jgi:predicted GNAT family acetyltransferase
MIGERLGTDQAQKLSAICTQPEYLGRGYARRLTAWLTGEVLARGLRPFLHVSYENTRAKALYEQLGYRTRADLPFGALARPADEEGKV